MKTLVTPGRAFVRGFTGACPNCGARGIHRGLWHLREACPRCGLTLEKGEGFFLGSMAMNYGLVVFGFLAPVAALWITDTIGEGTAAILAVLSLPLAVALHLPSRFWWLACYYAFLPHELPSNGGRGEEIVDR